MRQALLSSSLFSQLRKLRQRGFQILKQYAVKPGFNPSKSGSKLYAPNHCIIAWNSWHSTVWEETFGDPKGTTLNNSKHIVDAISNKVREKMMQWWSKYEASHAPPKFLHCPSRMEIQAKENYALLPEWNLSSHEASCCFAPMPLASTKAEKVKTGPGEHVRAAWAW